MLDTIASGKLDKQQENQLIRAFSGEAHGEYQERLELQEQPKNKESESIAIEFVQKD